MKADRRRSASMNFYRTWRNWTSCSLLVGRYNGQMLYKIVQTFLKQQKENTLYFSAVPIISISFKKIEITISAPLKFSSQWLRFHFYRQTGTKSVVFTQCVILLRFKKEILQYVTRWMKLENIMLSYANHRSTNTV